VYGWSICNRRAKQLANPFRPKNMAKLQVLIACPGSGTHHWMTLAIHFVYTDGSPGRKMGLIGAKVAGRTKAIIFQMVEVAFPGELFGKIVARIGTLRAAATSLRIAIGID
jgi:hypothetical protein